MAKTRNYGIDLLRAVFMFMVCMLHTLGQGGILSASVYGTTQYYVYWFLEILAYCAVDGFAIISGYMATDKPRKYEKLVDMWFQAFFYSFVVTAVFTIAGIYDWGKSDIIKCIMPVTFGKFWYFSAFFGLYFVIPVLNKFLFSTEEKTAKKVFLLAVVLFSVLGAIGDPFESKGGYSAIWLMVLYCIGVLAKRIKLFETRKTGAIVLGWFICVFLTWGVHAFLGIGRLTNYLSPTILLSGLLLVIIFSRIRVKGTHIGKLTPLVFGIYLLQLNQVVWTVIIKDAFIGVLYYPVYLGVLLVFGISAVIFISGLMVEFVRSKVASLIHLSVLSQKIVKKVDAILEKTSYLLR